MSTVYHYIIDKTKAGKKLFAVLIDPEKCIGERLTQLIQKADKAQPDFILVGGSQLTKSVEQTVIAIKALTNIPVVLFPGNAMQISDRCDAILLLSLLSGKNSEYIIDQHIKAAKRIKQSGVEVISTGYLLIDGGCRSAVEQVSGTLPLPADATDLITRTAIAGELLGCKLIYLEAGSGAKRPISGDTIKAVKRECRIPLIVGGGIVSITQLTVAMESGADLVVVGNHFETHPDDLAEFCRCVAEYNQKSRLH